MGCLGSPDGPSVGADFGRSAGRRRLSTKPYRHGAVNRRTLVAGCLPDRSYAALAWMPAGTEEQGPAVPGWSQNQPTGVELRAGTQHPSRSRGR